MIFKKEGIFMLTFDIQNQVLSFLQPFLDFFKNIWFEIRSFFLQYMSADVFNIFALGIGFALLLIIILAIMNHK